MKKLIYIIPLFVLLLTGCSDDKEPDFMTSLMVIDTEKVTAEGSYVQGSLLSDACKAVIPYTNGKGGKALVSAPKMNGMQIVEQEVTVEKEEGEMSVNITGTPINLEATFLQINITVGNQKYISSVEIPVVADPDPSGTVVLTLNKTFISNIVGEETITFTVEPTMAYVYIANEDVEDLGIRIAQDTEAGTGSITLNPGMNFLSETIQVAAEFGARPVQIENLTVSAFNKGDGSTDSPYEVETEIHLTKLNAGYNKAFILQNDLSVDNWIPAGTADQAFNGVLDGNGKKIEFAVNAPESNNVGFFAYIGSTAEIKNIILAGNVTGKNNVAALAANSEKTFGTDVDVSGVTVTGENNIASKAAAGSGKDGRIISFTDVPTVINIPIDNPSITEILGVTPHDVSVNFTTIPVGITASYNEATGEITLTKDPTFTPPGNLLFTISLSATGEGANIRSVQQTIEIQSKTMFESGTGIETDPYIVIDADQFSATLTNYPNAYVKIADNAGIIALDSWSTIPAFGGHLDGNGKTVTGLNNPFTALSTGTITNIKFTGVNISSTRTGFLGAIANESNGGHFEKISVTGTLTRTVASNDQPFGGIVGEINNKGTNSTIISNCYVNVVISSSVSAVGGIVGRVNSASGKPETIISFCTAEGEIIINGSLTKIGGVLGRKQNNGSSANKGDKITNCHVSMYIHSGAGDTGSNMIGGIFGAQQPGVESPSFITIDQCLFTGRVNGNNNVGGIGGICPPTSNCIVLGNGPTDNATISASLGGGTAASAGISSGAKGDITKCIVANARIESPRSGDTKYAAGIVSTRNAGNILATDNVVINTSVIAPGDNPGGFSIYGTAATGSNAVTATNNYYTDVTYVGGAAYVPLASDPNGQDGTKVERTAMSQAWFVSIGYDFTTIWEWDNINNLPKLRNVGCDASVK